MNRRQFIRAGVAGGVVLAAGGTFVALREASRGTSSATNERQRRLDRIVGAITPVLLANVLPVDPVAGSDVAKRVAIDVGRVIAGFTPPVQKEVDELFALLDIGIARRLLTGVSRDWPEADPVEIGAFLERWRYSRFETLQSGYHALHDLVFGAWYASPASWPAIGYAGPPQVGEK